MYVEHCGFQFLVSIGFFKVVVMHIIGFRIRVYKQIYDLGLSKKGADVWFGSHYETQWFGSRPQGMIFLYLGGRLVTNLESYFLDLSWWV